MSDNRAVAKDIIVEAARTILKDRPGVHGSAEQSFTMIADLWTVYLRHVRRVTGVDTIRPEDVSQMMTLLKKARSLYGDATNRDNFIDDVGYVALAGMLQLPDPDTTTDRILRENLDPTVAQTGLEGGSTGIVHKHENINAGRIPESESTKPIGEILSGLYNMKGVNE